MNIKTYTPESVANSAADSRLTWLTPKDTATDQSTIAKMRICSTSGKTISTSDSSLFISDVYPGAFRHGTGATYPYGNPGNADLVTAVRLLRDSLFEGSDAFILNTYQTTAMENANIVANYGDTSGLQFPGRQPQTLGITGKLVCDFAQGSDLSWFHAFLLGYRYLFRASRLAKWNCILQLILPDVGVFTGYPVELSYSLGAQSDMFIPFTMSMLLHRPNLLATSITEPNTLANVDYSRGFYEDWAASIDDPIIAINKDTNKKPTDKSLTAQVTDAATKTNTDATSSKVVATESVAEGEAIRSQTTDFLEARREKLNISTTAVNTAMSSSKRFRDVLDATASTEPMVFKPNFISADTIINAAQTIGEQSAGTSLSYTKYVSITGLGDRSIPRKFSPYPYDKSKIQEQENAVNTLQKF